MRHPEIRALIICLVSSAITFSGQAHADEDIAI